MIKLGKCQMVVCNCSVEAGKLFCSEDCRQAAAQGLEREFCQCFHASCKADTSGQLDVDLIGLKESFRFFEAGQITIDYRDQGHLIAQLQALAACLVAEEGRSNPLPTHRTGDDMERRPATSVVHGSNQAEAQSA